MNRMPPPEEERNAILMDLIVMRKAGFFGGTLAGIWDNKGGVRIEHGRATIYWRWWEARQKIEEWKAERKAGNEKKTRTGRSK